MGGMQAGELFECCAGCYQVVAALLARESRPHRPDVSGVGLKCLEQ